MSSDVTRRSQQLRDTPGCPSPAQGPRGPGWIWGGTAPAQGGCRREPRGHPGCCSAWGGWQQEEGNDCRRKGGRRKGWQQEEGMPTPPRWPLGLSEPSAGVCGPSRLFHGSHPSLPAPSRGCCAPSRSQHASPQTSSQQTFHPAGLGLAERGWGSPRVLPRVCSPPGLGTWALVPSQWLFVPSHALLLRQGRDGHGGCPGRGVPPCSGVQLAEAPALQALDVLAGAGAAWSIPSPSSDLPLSPSPNPFPKPVPGRAGPGAQGHTPLCPHVPLLWFLGGSSVPALLPPPPRALTEPLPAATPVQFPFIFPRSHSREVH